MTTLFFALFLFATLPWIYCSRILGVFPSPGYSQFILCEKLMTTLSERGHEVTVISPFKPKDEVKNYRTILIDGLVEKVQDNLFLQMDSSIITNTVWLYEFGNFLTEYTLSHKGVQNLIHSNETFDLVIVEQFINEAHMGFSRHFNAPLIIFSSLGLAEWNSHLVGNIKIPSVEPYSFSSFTNHMTFLQRLINSAFNAFDALYKYFVVFPEQQKILTRYFPNEIKLDEVMFNASLLLLNSHPITTHPTTLTSSVVEIGGFHISPTKLPEDVQKFLDEAKEGAVYFSMGSNAQTSDLSSDTINSIVKTFSKLPQRVLWKYHSNEVPNNLKNLLVSKWFPQNAHPNTVAFITHGGLLSTTEAIYYGVPMVGIPIFGDQNMNVARSVEKGIAVRLPFKKISEDALDRALKEVLTVPKYKENAKRASHILRDQVVKPLDLAVYWVEYVIRHAGAPHLRNSSLDLYWFQLYLLDIVSYILLFTMMFYNIFKLLAVKLIKGLVKKTKSKSALKNKKKTN